MVHNLFIVTAPEALLVDDECVDLCCSHPVLFLSAVPSLGERSHLASLQLRSPFPLEAGPCPCPRASSGRPSCARRVREDPVPDFQALAAHSRTPPPAPRPAMPSPATERSPENLLRWPQATFFVHNLHHYFRKVEIQLCKITEEAMCLKTGSFSGVFLWFGPWGYR